MDPLDLRDPLPDCRRDLVDPSRNTFAGVADILGFLFLVVGVFWLIQAIAERDTNDLWWFGLIAGIALIIMAVWTSGQCFIHKQYILLVFAGIWALFHGVDDIIRGFQIRRLKTLVYRFACGLAERVAAALWAERGVPRVRFRGALRGLGGEGKG
jgi:uncharacterized membrane protein HdeD (DUF308 family)